MGLNDTVSSERIHIGFFGMRNAGKSSLVNAITGQHLSVVSDVKGTTTDPVKKAMELLPLGPVVIIDTPGLDDEGELGSLRVKKAKQILGRTDIAVLVVDGTVGMQEPDRELVEEFTVRKTPYLVIYNKADLLATKADAFANENTIYVSATSGQGVFELKERIGSFGKSVKKEKLLVSDLIEAGDILVLVTPIDESAPKGRLILPQQLVVRDILDKHGIVVTCQDRELAQTLKVLAKKPKMVITDSQVFGKVGKEVPREIPLTSFSIVMARYKGELETLLRGAEALSKLQDGDKVLISEGCTHHRQCNDIGTVKMPQWIREFTGVEPEFVFTSGVDFPEELAQYSVIVHCGGCTLNEKEMQNRIEKAKNAKVPIVNYGMAIAHMNGILKRSVEMFEDVVIN